MPKFDQQLFLSDQLPEEFTPMAKNPKLGVRGGPNIKNN